jgi:hypothetical protein
MRIREMFSAFRPEYGLSPDEYPVADGVGISVAVGCIVLDGVPDGLVDGIAPAEDAGVQAANAPANIMIAARSAASLNALTMEYLP